MSIHGRYLSDLVFPTRLEDCTVDLLIGVDVPEALQPEKIRRGEPGGPLAVRTKFGWTLNGPLGQTEVAAAHCGKSLNEHVMQGPDLTNSLVGVLLRFRQENVALIADVEAMFHQVRVKEDDVSALRFLWFPNGDLSKDPEERQMLVHLFGGIWSPSCATFALQKTAEDHRAHFKDSVISTVKRNFYVERSFKVGKE
eukprot:gene8362-biopygen6189